LVDAINFPEFRRQFFSVWRDLAALVELITSAHGPLETVQTGFLDDSSSFIKNKNFKALLGLFQFELSKLP
jgi:hypothetical protein